LNNTRYILFKFLISSCT